MNIRFHNLWRSIKDLIPWINVKRSNYPIGFSCLSTIEFENALINHGFQYNYFSYTERGQVTNLRRLIIVNNELYQVHVRYFNDGEVRAHYEISYEEDVSRHLDASTMGEIDVLTAAEIRTAVA